MDNKKQIFDQIETQCKKFKCEEYIEWDFGYGTCVSCKLCGQSYHIDEIPEDCPNKDKFKFEMEEK